jgi:ribosome-binding protein aMBF1 (putative translation factor)
MKFPNRERKTMSKERLKHVNRPLTEDERERHAQIRSAAEKDFPPKPATPHAPSPPGIPAKIRQAREARGLTWYALAQAAGIANSGMIRDIEAGKDVKLSDLQSVATALGLQLDLVEQVA